jgi:competence protein ComEC
MVPGAGTIWRALGMVGVLGLARLGRRPVTTEQALVVTVFGVSVVSPLSLLDASLQLSALAVLGAVLGMRHFGAREHPAIREPVHVRAVHAARSIAGASLGATVATTPLVAGLSGLVSWVGPLANLIAVPIAGALTVVMLLAAVFAFAVPALGGGLTYVGGWMARALVGTSSWLGDQPWAAHKGDPWPTWLVIAAYGAIAAGLLVASSIRRRRMARGRSEPSHDRATEATGEEPGPGRRPDAR